tara:strand:+ start:1105 stop:1866 length:762 start_codon:yes stop_codon:yes gene_type:complete
MILPGFLNMDKFNFGDHMGENISFIAISVIIFLLNLINLARNRNMKNGWLVVFSLIILICGFLNIKKLDTDEKREHYKYTTITSIVLFLIAGLFAYLMNKLFGNSCGLDSKDLLCNKTRLTLFITMCISIYYMILTVKNSDENVLFLRETNDQYYFVGIFIIALWQLYLYMVLDGFRGGEILSKVKTGGGSTFEVVAFLTIVYIIGNFIITRISNSQCRDWGSPTLINNITEININILFTTVIGFLIVISTNR